MDIFFLPCKSDRDALNNGERHVNCIEQVRVDGTPPVLAQEILGWQSLGNDGQAWRSGKYRDTN